MFITILIRDERTLSPPPSLWHETCIRRIQPTGSRPSGVTGHCKQQDPLKRETWEREAQTKHTVCTASGRAKSEVVRQGEAKGRASEQRHVSI